MEQNNLQVKKLYRSRTNRIIFGVCGGLGEYFNIDPIIFRIIFVALTLGAGSGVLIYLILAFLTPKTPISDGADKEAKPTDLRNRVEGLASELREIDISSQKRNYLGIAIVIIGAVLLLNQLLPRHIFNWSVIWAVIIIFLGIWILKGGGRGSSNTDKHKHNSAESSPESAPVSDFKAKETVKEIHHYYHGRGGGIFRLFFGLVFLIVGFGFLAQKFDFIPGLNIDMSEILSFWPILIVLVGLSILSRGTWLGSLLSMIITLGIVVLLAFYLILPGSPKAIETFVFDIPKQENVKRAEILVNASASIIDIGGGAVGLASGSLESNVSTLKTDYDTDTGVQNARIKMDGNISGLRGKMSNTLNIKLSEEIPLSVNMESGASSIKIDSSNLILENFTLKTGASKVVLALGDKAENASVIIKSGVSSIEISTPKSVGARIEVKGALSQKNFVDFKRVRESIYETDDYGTSAKKIIIVLEAGVSSMSVIRK